MSEFIAITTQEEFDRRLADRLSREREKIAKQYEGYVSRDDHAKALASMQKQLEEASANAGESAKTIEELNKKVQRYETDSVKTRVALDYGLPLAMAARLQGEDEAALKADAEALAGMMRSAGGGAPSATQEPVQTMNSTEAAYHTLLSTLNQQ